LNEPRVTVITPKAEYHPGGGQPSKLNEPRVTVITPVRATRPEHTTWLNEAIASVSAQAVPVEMIVVDDHSTVDLATVREQWPSVLWLAADGEGCAAARNQAVHQAQTDLLLPLDGDDKFTPDAVVKFLKAWDNGGSKAGIVYSDVVMFGQDYSKMYIAPGYSFKILLHATFMTVGCLHRREDWAKAGGWRVDMEGGLEDWEYWITLGEMGVCGFHVAEPLYWYRRDARGRLARLKADPTRWQKAYQRMRDLHIQSYNGRYPMGCCGGASYPKGQRPKQSAAPRANVVTSPVPTGSLEMIQYIGNRMGDFGVAGQISRVRYHVPGKGMLVEDTNGRPGVAVGDVPFLLRLNQGRDFRRLPPTPPIAPPPPPPPPKSEPEREAEPEPELEEPKITPKAPEVAWARPATGDIRGKAIVGRAVKAAQAQQPAPTPVPVQEPVEAEDAKPKRERPKRVA